MEDDNILIDEISEGDPIEDVPVEDDPVEENPIEEDPEETAIEDVLITLLESLKYPVYRQGSLTKDKGYPDSFFTFWNVDSPDHSHYDNNNYGTDWNFEINFYSVDPALTYSVLADARILLKQNNWIVPSKGYDVRSDEASHTARGLTIFYLET